MRAGVHLFQAKARSITGKAGSTTGDLYPVAEADLPAQKQRFRTTCHPAFAKSAAEQYSFGRETEQSIGNTLLPILQIVRLEARCLPSQ